MKFFDNCGINLCDGNDSFLNYLNHLFLNFHMKNIYVFRIIQKILLG